MFLFLLCNIFCTVYYVFTRTKVVTVIILTIHIYVFFTLWPRNINARNIYIKLLDYNIHLYDLHCLEWGIRATASYCDHY